MKLAQVEYQPDFPAVDLSEVNADYLELLLQNEAIVADAHETAERSNMLYLLAHSIITQSGDRFPNKRGHASMQYGMKAYEITASIVTNSADILAKPTINIAARSLARVVQSDRMTDYFTDARDDFVEKQPVTNELINTVASRFFSHAEDYAVMGAAIERQLELEARETDETVRAKLGDSDLI